MAAPEPPATEIEVDATTVSLLGKQGPFRPSVRLLERDGARWVAKDYRACVAPYRWTVGRWNLRRESEAIERLRGIEGIPEIVARAGAWILVLTHFAGRDIGKVDKARQPPEFYDRLQTMVAAMHSRGVVHLDLRQRRNVLMQPGGQPALIDFGAALCLRPGSLLQRWLARIDESGVLKYKRRANPDSLTLEETGSLERVERRRRFWPFNR